MKKRNIVIQDMEDRMEDWEEADEFIMKEIRNKSEELEIPDSLLPENMMKKLRQELKEKTTIVPVRKNKKRFLKKTAAIAVVASVCVVSVFQLVNYKGTITLTNGRLGVGEVEYGKLEQGMVPATSREEIYDKIKNYDSLNLWGYGWSTLGKDENGQINNEGSSEMLPEGIEGDQVPDNQENYHKDTNEQVEGVSEGDYVKTDGKYIYIASKNGSSIRIVAAEKGYPAAISEIRLEEYLKDDLEAERAGDVANLLDEKEMYIDGDRLTLVISAMKKSSYGGGEWESAFRDDIDYEEYLYWQDSSKYINEIYILSFDISDKSHPKFLAKHSQQGKLNTSRVVDGYLYVLSNFYYDILDSGRYLPCVDGEEVSANSVYINENGGETYTIITALEIDSPEDLVTNINILSGSDLVYVSQKNIYLLEQEETKGETEQGDTLTEIYSSDTVINKFSYIAGKVEFKASSRVRGTIDKSFYLDEYNGGLRAVANVYTITARRETLDDSFVDSVIGEQNKATKYEQEQKIRQELEKKYGEDIYIRKESNKWKIRRFETVDENRVYTLDESLNILGQIEGIAKGEELHSARFMGNIGYFVTFKSIDPLFAVDFSNPSSPKILSELKVPGFSDYLHFWEENKLLGIGFDTEELDGDVRTSGYKLSMFDISDPENVTEEEMESKRNRYTDTWDYKSILISREKNVIGFEIWSDYGVPGYVVYSYDENHGFTERFKYDMELEDISSIRGIIINDVFYLILGDQRINTYDISQNYKLISEMKY
ncbi:MAG: hypothetical protein HFI34_10925 [Lachnospiraceae bacterium]|nr:hypothetical protein [Lachnospiraceae bacterium]